MRAFTNCEKKEKKRKKSDVIIGGM